MRDVITACNEVRKPLGMYVSHPLEVSWFFKPLLMALSCFRRRLLLSSSFLSALFMHSLSNCSRAEIVLLPGVSCLRSSTLA